MNAHSRHPLIVTTTLGCLTALLASPVSLFAQTESAVVAPVAAPVVATPSDSRADSATDADEVLGRVGEFEVRLSDVRRSLDTLTEPEREAMRREPAALNQYVRALLVQQLVLREASSAGWDKSAKVEERMRLLRDGVVANTYLESVSEPPAAFPSEAELNAVYQANREALQVPKSWRLAQIFVADPQTGEEKSPSPETKAKLDRIQASLASPEADFAALAKAESDEPASAARGGEIGWLTEPQIHPDVRDALPGLSVGKLSEPVRLQDGWHIILVLDVREAHIPTFDQIRDRLADRMRAEKGRADSQAFLGRLLQQNPIAINEMMLSKLIPAEAK
ncbi:MAG: peptidylprolyl isomerase [Verrucomicrobiae bacterium]|nr:peptidylprolyl isomerase [Verrucomicrobiae bacterium]